MLKKVLFGFALATIAIGVKGQNVLVNCSESDAKIYVDGQNLGTGTLKVRVPKNACVNVKVQKVGYLTAEQTYCNKNGGTKPPKRQYFELAKDDAFEASVQTDQANVDFSVVVNPKYSLSDAWKLATQIVTDYFDAIEVSDKETSYLRTAWVVQTFKQNTIRSRFIIKLGNSSPLTYKVKLVSEYSGVAGTSVKSDELYHEWDRLLRKYENVVGDFNTRLGVK